MRSTTYFETACKIFNMAPDELQKFMNIQHPKTDEMIKDAWDKLNPRTEEDIIKFYTDHMAYSLNLLIYYHNTTKDHVDAVFFNKLYEYLPNIREYSILEYGCGSGRRSLALINSGCKSVYLADIPTPMFKVVRHNLSSYIGEDKFLIILEKFPLKINYDLIICEETFEHVKDPDLVLKHIVDHTKYLYMSSYFSGSGWCPVHLKENEDKYAQGEPWDNVVSSVGLVPVFIEKGTRTNGLYINKNCI